MHSERLRWTTITIAIFSIILITSTGLLACVRKTVTPASSPTSTPNTTETACELTGGETVESGWTGKDTGDNSCNSCSCTNGDLACTEMACPARSVNSDSEPTPTSAPTSTPTSAPTSTPTSTPTTQQLEASKKKQLCSVSELKLWKLGKSIETAMSTYDGDPYSGSYSFALIDTYCSQTLTINKERLQYPASAAKIVIAIAVLHAVEKGELTFEEIQPDLEIMMRKSLDLNSDILNNLITPEQVQEILKKSNVSPLTRFFHSWRETAMTAKDLARIWKALIAGELLDETLTNYLLNLTTQAIIPEAFVTFPTDKIEGFNYGQKAGYWINDEGDERLIGAGYLIEQNNSERGYVIVFMTQGDEADDLWDRSRLATSPRHKVWPLILGFVTEQAQASPN